MGTSFVRTVVSISLVLYFVGLFVTTVDSVDCSGMPNCVPLMCSTPSYCTECERYNGVKEADAQNAHCEPCSKNAFCAECTNMTYCTKCNNTAKYGPDKSGVGTCSLCKENCLSCKDSGGGSCDFCAQGYTLVSGSCASCSNNCSVCKVNGAGKCDSCMNGYGLVESSKLCDMCKPNCTRCASNISQCTTCNSAYPMTPAKDGSGMCLDCAANCMTCTVAGSMSCDECMATFTKTMGANGKFTCEKSSACPIQMRSVWTNTPVPASVPPHDGLWTEVILHHTMTDPCWTDETCVKLCNAIETHQKTTLKLPCAVYNYFVGENGKSYAARGWSNQGDHLKNHNAVALGIAVIGTFTARDPNAKAKEALDMLLTPACIEYLHIDPNFKLYTHYDWVCTRCPGKNLRHWSEAHFEPKWGRVQVTCPEAGRNFPKPMKK